MQTARKSIIRFAIDYDIRDICTYAGYKGDLILKLTTSSKDDVLSIRRYALTQKVKEVVVKHLPSSNMYEIFCVTEDEKHYEIKFDDDKPKHVHDVWDTSTR